MNSTFKYTTAAASAKPGYLANKWDRLYPGWRKPTKERKQDESKPIPRTAVVVVAKKRASIR